MGSDRMDFTGECSDPTLISIPLFVTSSNGADFTLDDAIAAAD